MTVYYQAAGRPDRLLLRASTGSSPLAQGVQVGVPLDALVASEDAREVRDATARTLAAHGEQVLRYRLRMPGGGAVEIEDYQTVVGEGTRLEIHGFLIERPKAGAHDLESLRSTALSLVHVNWLAFASIDACIRRISHVASRTLAVRRVSVWLYNEDRSQLVCQDLFDGDDMSHHAGRQLEVSDYPDYFAAIDNERFVVANDARANSLTRAFTQDYLKPANIGAMLDAPIHSEGRTAGVICLEHVGNTRQWSPVEQDFAATLADVVSLIIEQWRRRQLEEEQIRLERKIMDSRRNRALGLLTAGIAHDFNNLLTPIVGQTSILLDELESQSPLRRQLEDIHHSAVRAADLIQQLLTYSGKADLEMQLIRPDELLEQLRNRLAQSSHRQRTVRWQPGSDLDPLRMDAQRLSQVLENIIENAFESAGERDPEVRVSAGQARVDAQQLVDYVDGEALAAGSYAWIEVSDRGVGMDEATLAQACDPFFSTRRPGRGMGLATARSIVTAHGGAMRIRSKPGRGTQVRLILPLPATGHARSELDNRRVLIVDDTPAIASLLAEMSRNLGMVPQVATDGAEAIDLFKKLQGTIDIAVVDMKMPSLNGLDVMEIMAAREPELPIILCSGSSPDECSPSTRRRRYTRFLRKPFSVADFTSTVRAALSDSDFIQ